MKQASKHANQKCKERKKERKILTCTNWPNEKYVKSNAQALFLIMLFQSNSTWLCFGEKLTRRSLGAASWRIGNHTSLCSTHPPAQNIHGPCYVRHWSQAISSILCPFSHQYWRQSGIWLKAKNTEWDEKHVKKHLLYFGLLEYCYLELLVGEAAAGAAGALDSDGRCSFWTTHFQERGEHAPPENTASTQLSTFPYIITQ